MRHTKNLSYKKAITSVTITNSNEAYFYFKSIWDKEPNNNMQEQFYALFLNRAKEVISWRCLPTVTMRNAHTNKRLLFGLAYNCMASVVLIAHSDPTGQIKPSVEDLIATKELAQASNLLGIVLLDHLVIGDNGYYSFLSNEEISSIGLEATKEKPQTLAQYNKDLEKGNTEIERGEFTTAADLKAEASKW